MSGEIAAVDGRNILRPHRLQRPRGMPVEIMTTKLLQLVQTCKRKFETLEQLDQADVAKVVSGESREQQQPDVRWGSAMSDDLWLFLNIVRWQPMIFVADKGLKEPPRAPGHDASRAHVSGGNLLHVFNAMTADVKSY